MQRIANGVWKVRYGEPEQHTPVTLGQKGIQYDALEQLQCEGKSPIANTDISVRMTSRGTVVELPLRHDEEIYGFGLQFYRLKQTGRKRVIRVNSDPIADTGDSHAPVPFYISTAGYGVFIDTSRYATFYCGTNLPKGASRRKTSSEGELGTSEKELYGHQAAQGDLSILVDVPSAKGIDIYLFEGPTIKTAIQRYNLFSGGGCLPPLWGLGMWYRFYTAANESDTERLATMFREERMPVDVLGFEPGWHSQAYSCSFSWNKEGFPNHEKLINRLNEMNYHVNLWEHVFTHPSSEMYEELLPYSADFEVWKGLVPDFATKESSEIFSSYHLHNFVENGISGFKLDECDSSDYVQSNWSFPDVASFPSGLDGEQMHNQLGLLYQSTMQSTFDTAGIRTFSQVRSSGALAASYPFVLYSDLYQHDVFIRGLVNSGFAGLLWSPEVRSASSVEDFIRRIQTTVFSPMAVLNCWTFPNPPWMQVDRDKNRKGEFFDNYEEVQEACRHLFELRMSLIPYLYASFAQYHQRGIPPFRALVMDYPDDANTYEIDDSYMMGDSILVAPLIAGQTERKVYLPRGTWKDFWTNETYAGETWYDIAADLDHIPVFVKDNTLLPIATPLQCVADDAVFEIVVRIYGDSPKDFVLYEDDGRTLSYRDGVSNSVTLSWSPDHGGSVTRVGDYSGVKYKVVDWVKQRTDLSN